MKRLLMLLLVGLFVFVQAHAQSRTVRGTVKDENGKPLTGVTVRIQGTTKSSITNAKGDFTISVSTQEKQLEFLYVGYDTKVVDVQNLEVVAVSLAPTPGSLQDVVVTGYSTVKRSQYSGATTKVGKEKINNVPVASFDQVLQGRVPGLLVTSGSGQPGTASRVQIRGQGSITGGNEPLYIVDGMPVEASNFRSLNPNDFESVEVLRDAVATAQYGNRAGSGVIVITTKKGKTGKPALSFTTSYGITQPGQQKFDMMNSSELLKYQELLGQQVDNGLLGWVLSPLNPNNVGASPDQLAANAKALDSLRNINTDWQGVFMRNGNFMSHDLNLAGGTETSRFYVGAGYYAEDGIGVRSSLKRYTFRANFDSRTDKLTFSANSGVGYTKSSFIESENGVALANPFAAAYLALPYDVLFKADGTTAVGPGKTGANAYDRLFHTTQLSNQIKGNLSSTLNYDITRNVSIGGFAGLDYRQTVTERAVYPGSYAASTAGFPGNTGSYGNGYNNSFEYIVRGNAGYKNTFADDHDVNLRFVSEYSRSYFKGFNYAGYGINEKLLNTPAGITPGTVNNRLIPAVGGFKSERALFALMVLGDYTYKGKYILNFSVRRDGASVLPPDTRFQTFYGVGVAWNVMKEKFAENWTVINDLRVRASYGSGAQADNFPQGLYGFLPLYGQGIYAGNLTTVATTPGNPDLVWEKVYTTNLGINLAAFKNRLNLTLDVYDKTIKDNIVEQKLSLTSGFRTQFINAATVQNRGVELSLNYNIIQSKSFLWSIGGNIAYNHNEVTDLGQVDEFEQGTELVKVGLPLGSHYIVKWGGVDAATGRPLYYDKNGKLTTAYSDDDRVSEFGTYNAPWIGGFNTSINYKGFSLDALFTFQQGFSRFNNQDFFQLNHAFAISGYNVRREMLDMWSTPKQVTNIQGPLYQRQFTSKDIQDASFLRFRNLTLAYNFAPGVIQSLKVLSAARFFVQGQNLYTWTNWVGFDPEDSDNIAQYEYPTPRTFTVGLQVTFK